MATGNDGNAAQDESSGLADTTEDRTGRASGGGGAAGTEPQGGSSSAPLGGQATAGTDPIIPERSGGALGGANGAGDYDAGSGGAGADLSGTRQADGE